MPASPAARRRAPLRFGTQLLLVLGAALLLADTIVLAGWWRASGGLHPIAREQSLGRLVAVFRLAEVARPERIGVLLGATQSLQARFQVAAAPTLPDAPMTREERSIAQELGDRLGLDPTAARVHLGPIDQLETAGHRWQPPWWPGQPPNGLVVSLPLADGRWLDSRLAPLDRPGGMLLTASSLVASAGLMAAMIALALRRMLRPWRALADTMQRFGRGERPPPLPLAGPRELRELTGSFNQLQRQLARHVDERTRLLGSISHDLRSPLTALRLRVELVDDDAVRAAMQRTLAELQALVDQTLHFARDEHHVEVVETLDLAALCADVVDDRRQAGHDVRLNAPAGPVPWRGRPLALRRALGNLVDNAVRHGRSTRVSLHAGPATSAETAAADAARAQGGPVIHVDDDGPGIPEDLLDRVFEPYVRADAAEDGRDGVGLGLAIALGCVQSHGGTLTLVNRAGGGLRATVALPA